ncbi:hypothetical protein [Olleya marilimosa]|uniref:Uncharacterized protein n=1 Tax=Olleya marilimosa TaxID=272164 RepID=A0ABR8LQ10_9FLAO|nr:hypothetical protein [Olleya marilimosa]MBD3862318.1 hypothetical protein [Olleya marilimosa]
MSYRIFYSYQSDIKKKLNQIFIREAINAAIAKITDFKIEPLIEGFYGKGGNPPLAETMLKQSKGSDIFIGDVTFTSSKIWQSKGVNFYEDSSTYLIEIDKPIDLKPAPNPNVLLETGYSWALKSFNRSILVMNEAFGHPSLLPVDMSNLRHPITYNLTEERHSLKSKYKKELENLTLALEGAIRDAINSSIEYQIEHWRPFIVHSQWKKDHAFPFYLTPLVKKKIVELRDLILKDKKPIRFTGLIGCGKTRLVLEALQKHGDLPRHTLSEQIIYYDFEGITSGEVSRELAELKDLNQQKIFVADNCSLKKHIKLSKHFRGTNIKVITIKTIKDVTKTEHATIFFDEDITVEIFESIIKEKFSSSSILEVIDKLGRNLENFIQLIQSGVIEGDLTKSTIELLNILLEDKNIKKGAFKFLIAISVFNQIGVSGQPKSQIEFIRSVFVGCSESEINELIELLEYKNLIEAKGDYIVINSFKEELVKFWKSESIDNLEDIIKGVTKNKLWYDFKKPFFQLLKQKPELVTRLVGEGGLLSDKKFIDSRFGGEFINLFADYYPEEALSVLKQKFK